MELLLCKLAPAVQCLCDVSGLFCLRLAEACCRAAVQLLLVQACGEVYVSHAPRLPHVSCKTSLALLGRSAPVCALLASVPGVGAHHHGSGTCSTCAKGWLDSLGAVQAAAVLLVDTLGASKRAPSTPTSCAAARSRPRSWQTRRAQHVQSDQALPS